jgi:membrane fusion protein, multidrug efflux system
VNKTAIFSAAGLAIALVLWLASGHLTRESAGAPAQERSAAREPFLVQVSLREARPIVRTLSLQGQTEPNRRVTLRAETSGAVAEILAERGSRVEHGQPILRLSEAERSSRLREARARVEQRRAAHQAARELAREGFQSALEAQQTFAALQQAQAELEAAEEAMRHTRIRAPFAGVLNNRFVEVGDYLAPGAELGVLVELDPLVIRIDVPQLEIHRIARDSRVEVRLLGGEPLAGRIRYISMSADAATRTFPVEIEIANPEGRHRAGVSARVEVALETVDAHFLSPALLSLNAEGVLGVKTADAQEQVRFHPVELVRSDVQGVWVTGLPEQAHIITRGQGYVEEGQSVRIQLARKDETLPDE